ncbi:L-2-hydroxyglutarate dehydrogenase, mitochondrial isoform X1 [Selaginella moellendorffii]|uniref:L-2-hydroxyglutarate dehydrogenase, mitochondrial isoform X1 n=1 Tax=Selaginella moellendorffii TaxID=88036 RepID=UPI000D1C8713|nr:L-2-hydroxyglutarate dehydrogenase, mitochondrial isoform X1 [Selaginella moellendorffii]|eukprot:XP_024530644.1 L-2-hydroxyglutarate dehydrogenase, mitochondrial isoform X1 [Selaginella moellendorffii]
MRRWGSIRAPREAVECVVIGAGIVGMAIARQLAIAGKNVVVVEAGSAVGTGTSSRNSQVIHAGIYYPVRSLKAALCVLGNKAMYSYCQERSIPFKRLGKLIVATSLQQAKTLLRLQETGVANGAEDLRMITAAEAMAMEPELNCVKALWSPSTGIVDSHSLMLSLQADAEEKGVALALNSTVLGGTVRSDGGLDIVVHETSSAANKSVDELVSTAEMVLSASYVINSAGLHATAIARNIEGLSSSSIPENYFAKGNYFAISSSKAPFSRLIYPVPEEGGLGVHLTIDLGGATRFGPDVQWLKLSTTSVTTEFDYSVDPARARSFYPEIRKYFPGLPDESLVPDYSGVRSKLCGPGQGGSGCSDFMIQGKKDHGIPGLVHLFGIESPGLTACMEIAKRVCQIL